ncbi:FusB/FusC family EF-G-binding protein [Planococcus sp. CP5-4]|uniref:FusB/FusC family EF-G-binding protein n=1 Tax=unclassified Planococcus (in: firmicutes) TaxID=2662419 RepID=UPI001C211D2D|nr:MULTISPECIES: FusB/FusC family EF-G-binding protein [unclassified Planococcus (in: firmicutes)]MBU9674761.1 FusB/FusC family EF-G-binding protein [Planococcus sp. CP5-4_YE]MBV0908857.1 FusB/FusC family EF-G-binding protein [Planococcus sp. CP5-4_UN]MBW6063906.1 FusB/FusC family EF-G-binding protein [Planococcus sp. CP5-4]
MTQTEQNRAENNISGMRVDAFIRNDQFNFIKNQAKILVHGKAASNDREIVEVLRHLAQEKVFGLFPTVTEAQASLLGELKDIADQAQADAYLEQLEPYLLPFKQVAPAELKRLFPKAKKLKGPKLESLDFKRTSYLGWIESSNLMCVVTEQNGQLYGIHGIFTRSSKQGICSICNRHSEVGMFIAKTKGSIQDHFIKRGNYICQDSETCNEHIDTLERLAEFVGRLQK